MMQGLNTVFGGVQAGAWLGSGQLGSFRWGERTREPARQEPRPAKRYHPQPDLLWGD
jgi:hypothetical protein